MTSPASIAFASRLKGHLEAKEPRHLCETRLGTLMPIPQTAIGGNQIQANIVLQGVLVNFNLLKNPYDIEHIYIYIYIYIYTEIHILKIMKTPFSPF